MTQPQELRVTRHSLDRVTSWLKRDMPSHARTHLVAFFAKIVLALLVSSALYALITFLIFYMIVRLSDLGPGMLLIPALPIAIAFFFQALEHRNTHGVMHVRGKKVRFVDDKTAITGNDEPFSTAQWLLFPAWIFFSAFDSLMQARRAAVADKGLCAEILIGLAVADRRAPIAELEMQIDDKRLPGAVKGLIAVPGVLVTNREYPCLMLSSELIETVRAKL